VPKSCQFTGGVNAHGGQILHPLANCWPPTIFFPFGLPRLSRMVAPRNAQVNLTDHGKAKGLRMYQILCVLIATITYGTAAGHCQVPQTGTPAFTFQSSTYSDFRQLLTREAAPATVTVRTNLGFPEAARDRYPAVVIVHTMGGYREANEGYAAAQLRKSGFVTLTYDSFAARGTTGEAMSRSPGYLPSGVADAYAALRLLLSEPRIDADRIAIVGFSFGGEVLIWRHLSRFDRR
jgi:predicted alpha/beta-fold hydrolase